MLQTRVAFSQGSPPAWFISHASAVARVVLVDNAQPPAPNASAVFCFVTACAVTIHHGEKP